MIRKDRDIIGELQLKCVENFGLLVFRQVREMLAIFQFLERLGRRLMMSWRILDLLFLVWASWSWKTLTGNWQILFMSVQVGL